MLGSTLVLGGDRVGVVPRHADRGPAKAGLLLTLGHDGVEHRCVEMAERMEVDVTRHASAVPDASERLADRIRVRRYRPAGLEREDEAVVRELDFAHRGQGLLFCLQLGQPLHGYRVDCRAPDACPSLRALHFGAARRHHDALVDPDSSGLEVEVGPPKPTSFAPPHPRGGEDSKTGCDSRIKGAVLGGRQQGVDLLQLGGPNFASLVDGPRWQLRVGDGVG